MRSERDGGFGTLNEQGMSTNEKSSNDDGFISAVITGASIFLIAVTFPVSIFFCIRMVQASFNIMKKNPHGHNNLKRHFDWTVPTNLVPDETTLGEYCATTQRSRLF
jgi:hypothetical protein